MDYKQQFFTAFVQKHFAASKIFSSDINFRFATIAGFPTPTFGQSVKDFVFEPNSNTIVSLDC